MKILVLIINPTKVNRAYLFGAQLSGVYLN